MQLLLIEERNIIVQPRKSSIALLFEFQELVPCLQACKGQRLHYIELKASPSQGLV